MTRRRVPRLALAPVVGLVLLAGAACTPGQAPDAPPSNAPSPRVLVLDRFDRDVSDGWGSADQGGPWESAAQDALSVGGGQGSIALAKPGTGQTVSLVNPQPADVRASVDVVAPDTTRLGGGLYVGLQVRSGGGSYYRCKVRFTSGIAFVSVTRQDARATAERALSREFKVAEKVKAGEVFRFSCQAAGAGPVRLYASALRAGAKPAWQVQTEDATASAIVTGGPTAVWNYLSGSSKVPTRTVFDEVSVTTLGAGLGAAGPPTASPGPSASAPGGAAGSASLSGWERAGAPAPGSTTYPVPGDAVHVSPVATSAYGDGTAAAPFATVAAAVDAAPDGATLVLHAGTYHESVVLPRDKRLTLQAAPREAVWFDGSSVVPVWRPAGSRWVSDGWTTSFDASPTYTRGAPEDDRPGWRFVNKAHPMAAHPDQVFVDGKAQRQVGSRQAVRPGSFYVDEKADQLVLGTDPVGHEVRASTLSTAITVLGTGDVVRGVGVRRYATSVWQLGVVAANVPHVTVADTVVSDNATTGLSVIAPDVALSHVTATRNGLMGIHVNEADRLSADGISVSRNNLEHFNRAPSAGGLKMTRSADVTVEGSSFADNLGHGFWCDMSCDGVDLVRSRFVRNTGSGVVFEISRGLLLAGSLVARNRLEGLWLIDSDRLEVAANAVLDNGRSAVRLVQDGRSADAEPGALPWTLADVALYGNVVRASSTTSPVSLVDYTRSIDPGTRALALGHDVYQQHGAGASTPFAEWVDGSGQPVTVDGLGAFQKRFGQETGTVLSPADADLVDTDGRAKPDLNGLVPGVAPVASPAVQRALGAAPGARVLGTSPGSRR